MNGDYAGKLVPFGHEFLSKGTVKELPSHALTAGVMGSTSPTYRFEFNTDTTILARVTDGTTTVFSADTSGNVTARTVSIDPKTATAVPLTVTNNIGTNQNLIEVYINPSILTSWVSNAGAYSSIANFGYYNATGDLEALSRFGVDTLSGKPGLALGPGGGTTADTNLYRNSAAILKTDNQFRATDGAQTIYINGAGKVNAADGDFVKTPGDGMQAVVRNSSTGDVYFCVRANSAWKAHGPL